MHDPFQMYSSLLGMQQNPYAINPLAAMGIPQGVAGGWGQHPMQSGIPGYGAQGISPFAAWQNPQQLYGGGQGQQNPFYGGGQGQQNPFYGGAQHPLQHLAQHHLLALALQNPLLNPILAQQYLYPQIAPQYGYGQQGGPQFGQGGQQFGQGISPLAQLANPLQQTGYPLAPQTWIGQQGLGSGMFSQLAGRGLQGISPWGGF